MLYQKQNSTSFWHPENKMYQIFYLRLTLLVYENEVYNNNNNLGGKKITR